MLGLEDCLDISYLSGFMLFCLDLGGFTWILCIPGAEGLATCGSLKGQAAAPLTNLCSDAGVGRIPGVGGFVFQVYFDGFVFDVQFIQRDGLDGKTSHTLDA